MHKLKLFIALGWTLTIIVSCLAPAKSISDLQVPFLGYDKVLHTGIYFFLVLFWLIYFQPNKQSLKKVNSKVAISAFCLGVFIEFLQATLTTSRFADVYDVLANTVGIVLALVAYQQYIKIKTN